MKPSDLLFHGWRVDPWVLTVLLLAGVAYATVFRRDGRWHWFAIAWALAAVTLLSPLDAIARGVLFSAHMAQHLILLLIVPALALTGLPAGFSLTNNRISAADRGGDRGPLTPKRMAILGWTLGIGAMWIWHAPALCDAAATTALVHVVQSFTLIGAGLFFWWPILAPGTKDRLPPAYGVGYLFSACLACTALGIVLTLRPIEVCSAFRAPLGAGNRWASLRGAISPEHDQQIGGLLMWVPMCAVYVGAIMLELARWFGEAGTPSVKAPLEDSR